MKFSLVVFLGLCAFVSTSDIFQDIPDVDFITYEPMVIPRTGDITLPTEINEYMKKTTLDFNGLIQKFKDISSKVRNDVEAHVAKKREQINDKAAALVQDITDLAKKGSKYVACGKQHQNKIIDITAAVQVNIEACTAEIVAALKIFGKEVLSASLVLARDFIELKDIALECYNKSTIGSVKCVWDHINELRTVIGNIVMATKQTIDSFMLHGKDVIASAKSCNENQVQTTLVKYQSFKTLLIECANN